MSTNKLIRLVEIQNQQIDSKPSRYIYIVSEDTYACKDYIEILKKRYNKCSKHIIICISNKPSHGGTQPKKLFLFCKLLQFAISSENKEQLSEKMQKFCTKACPYNKKTCTDKNCIYNKGLTDGLYKELEEIKKNSQIERPRSTKNDSFWIACDVDNNTHKDLQEVISNAKNFGIKFAISNISIETWFLFHFLDYENASDPKEALRDFEDYIKKRGISQPYEKTKLINKGNRTFNEKKKTLKGLESLFDLKSISHAKERTEKKNNSDNDLEIPKNPGSTMYKIIIDIEELINNPNIPASAF